VSGLLEASSPFGYLDTNRLVGTHQELVRRDAGKRAFQGAAYQSTNTENAGTVVHGTIECSS